MLYLFTQKLHIVEHMDSFPLHSSKVNSFCSELKITSPMAQIYVVSSKNRWKEPACQEASPGIHSLRA